MNESKLNHVRGAALDRIEHYERRVKQLFISVLVLEAAFLASFVLLANFKDRLHVLLLLSTVTVYSILLIGLFALGAHVSRHAQLILRAIELAGDGAAKR